MGIQSMSSFNKDEFLEKGHEGDLSFMTQSDYDMIAEIYGDDLEFLKEASWNQLPHEIKDIIVMAKTRSADQPIKLLTKVEDDKCAYCKSDLVEIPITMPNEMCSNPNWRKCVFENEICVRCGSKLPKMFDCVIAHEDQINGKSRMTRCQSMKNMLGLDIDKDKEFLANSEDKVVHDSYIAKFNYTTDEIKAKKNDINIILSENVKIGRKVTTDYYTYSIETKTIYNAEINKKDGKLLNEPIRVCQLSLEEYLTKIPKGFKVSKIVDIGCGDHINRAMCDCRRHTRPDGSFLPASSDEVRSYENREHVKCADDVYEVVETRDWAECKKLHAKVRYVNVYFQRIDSEMDERIIGVLNQRRLVECNLEYVRSVKVLDSLRFGVGLIGYKESKPFVTARLKKLAKDGVIEMDSIDRHVSQSNSKGTKTVWATNKLNTYRAKNPYAIKTPYFISNEHATEFEKEHGVIKGEKGRRARFRARPKYIMRGHHQTKRMVDEEMQLWNFIETNGVKCVRPSWFTIYPQNASHFKPFTEKTYTATEVLASV